MVRTDEDTESAMEEKREIWRTTLGLMNDRFKSCLDANVFEGVRDEKIYHGLKLTASIALGKTFSYMCLCEETEEYLLLDESVEVRRYSMQGKLITPSYPLLPTWAFKRMLWCSGPKWLACYDPEGEDIWMMSTKCTLVQNIKNEFRTKSLYYEPKTNELIVVGPHHTAVSLILRKKYLLEAKEDEKDKELEATKALNYNDPEFGPMWQLERTSLIPQSESAPARLVTSYVSTIYIMPLEMEEGMDEEQDPIQHLKRRTNAAKAGITTILYHDVSSWILVGDMQGNVMAFNLDLECTMSHTGAHEDRLLRLAAHPSICGFLSYSNGSQGGSRLQVWSCNFRDKIEAFTDFGKITSVVPIPAAAMVAVLSDKLYFLIMNQLYIFFAPLTSVARSLFSTANPMYLTKVISASEDNSVRVFSTQGTQLNVQILPPGSLHVIYASFSGTTNSLFTVILKSGEILISDYSTCPVKYRRVLLNDGPQVTCVTIYEYFDEIRDNEGHPRDPRLFYPISIRIIVGTEEGNLVAINDLSGKPEAVIPAHTGAVTQLRSTTEQQRLVSLGLDRCVKVWRVFADMHKPLAVNYTLYFILPITRVEIMGNVVCMVNSSAKSKVHQVIMENMPERIRLSHQSSYDHTGQIINMITSDLLEICATSSLDKTIRIWDSENKLVKILELNTIPWQLTFGSARGDIVFSAARHLYKIPYGNYLSPKYRARIIGNEIVEENDEQPVPEDPEFRVYEDVVEREPMLHPVSSTPLACIDIRDPDNPRVADLILEQICSILECRDEDVIKIKDNLIAPPKLSGNRSLMTSDVWEKYVNDLLKKMTRQPAQTPDYNFHDIRKKKLLVKKDFNDRGVFFMLYGYDAYELEDPSELPELVKGSRLPLFGFLPNSLLYKMKEKVVPKAPSTEAVKKEPVKYRYPPEFYPEEEEEEVEVRRSIRLSELL